MPVEVERDQGEVSVTETKPEVVVSATKEDVVNGISHGDNNGNGNDTDGSYVFISENDAVGDDSVESDSVKSVDANVVDKDLKEGDDNMNSDQLNMEATSIAGDDVLGVSHESQTLEKSEQVRTDDGPKEVVGIPKSEIEDSLEKSVEPENPGNEHLGSGHEGELESTEEVEQLQDSEVGPRDLTKNNVEEPEGKMESDSKTDVEEHQGDMIEAKDKSDVDVDVSEDLQHSEDVAKPPVDSDQGRESELVSSKVFPADPNDGTDPAVNDPIGSESVAVLESASVENGHPIIESELEKIGDVPCTLKKVNASDGDVLPDSGTVKVVVSEVSSDVPAETQTLTAVSLESHASGKDGVVENGNSKLESEAIQDLDCVETREVQSEIGAVDVSVSDGSMNIHPESQDDSEPACDEDGKQHIASEVTDILDAPASEVRSDDVIVAEKSVSEDAADRTDDKVASTCEIGETRNDLPPALSIEGPALDASERHTVAAEIERRPFYFLPRVPRYDDEKLSEQLKHAEYQVDQKTKSRDALRSDIQKIRATCKDYDISYKAVMAEERSAIKAMHSKRQEIEALQSVISRVKSAASVDDIDSRVHNMEHIIQHETISLKEEKGLIREIKQLKQLREQISSSMGTKDEVKQALEEQEKTEERLKVLRKELATLRNDLSKAEAVTKAAKKKCDEEWEVQSKLQEQFRAADAVRQEAFVHLQDLKKQQREKNKYFFKYRDDSRVASEMALKKDRAALQSLCSDQVENFMNMWNNDEEFRNYYVRCNTRSTYRRLGTLDGRSLGPDEEPPRITYATRTDKIRTSSDRVEKLETVPPVSAQQEKVVNYEGSKVENNGKTVTKPAEQKSQITKSKKTVKPDQPAPAPAPIVTELVSAKEEIEKSATKEEEEPPKLTKEEEELIKKEEEKRKQKEAAKMKEQHRLEEIAKAKEAMERKKKREEKAKARAVLKAQKEAEEREKEREKKLRKKERRNGIFTSEETATEKPIQTSETVIETPREIEIPKKQTVEESQQIKKCHKPSSQFLKQNKSKSVPLPLRNRGSKRKLRQWMWIGLIVVVILALFLLSNVNLSFSPANLWFI
ncbi:Proton pump-interactor [Cardamine amara subsp. amara]|uniref:Proton pump-interactor n=1 Tax=Cardamine amara subsp. amara TaxID=228776 RepID=A0ABD1BRD3_CARAN